MMPEPTPVSGSEKGSVASPSRTVIVTTAGLTASAARVTVEGSSSAAWPGVAVGPSNGDGVAGAFAARFDRFVADMAM